MMEGNYQRILEKISKASGLTISDLELKVDEKRNKLSGLISKEGAAQVIATELGVSFENEKLKIDELLPGMRRVNLIGKIFDVSPVRTFKTKKGDDSKVVNLWIADDTANVKIVLWDTNHIGFIERGEIAKGAVVEIGNASMRDNEVHLGSFSDFRPSDEKFDKIVTEKITREKPIAEFKKGETVSVRAFIVQMFEPKFFNTCPQCGKKVTTEGDSLLCLEHGRVVPQKKFVANMVLDDGTESIRSVMFHKTLLELGFTDLENPQQVLSEKESFLGKEMIFSGNVRTNAFFNTDEFIVDSVKPVDLDEVIKKLEMKA